MINYTQTEPLQSSLPTHNVSCAYAWDLCDAVFFWHNPNVTAMCASKVFRVRSLWRI